MSNKKIAKYVVTEEDFWNALMKYAERPGEMRSIAELLEDTDAADDDAILQLAAFGEIRYG